MKVLVACRHGEEREKCERCAARRAYLARWRAANPDKLRAYSKKWIEANPEKRAEAVKNWRKRNPEKVAAMNAKAGARWSKENAGRRNALTNKRRAALRQRMVPWADHEAIAAVYEDAARLTRETGVPHEVDHIVPLQGRLVSGLHVHQNLRVILRSENRAKQNRWSQ